MVHEVVRRRAALVGSLFLIQVALGCGESSDSADAGDSADTCELPGNDSRCGACTQGGMLAGLEEGDSCAFLGIPFALPPVGELRWTAPAPAEAWDGVRDATAHADACPQGQAFLAGQGEISEDCLYLNVHAPADSADAADAALPVMVFIHGGGYTAGTARTFSGRGLSELGPAVVVIAQYRLSALGFLSHPAMDAERGDAPAGSDGIRDQQLALQWVHDNISAFGGDPANVTVFGESAGSSAVNVLQVSPGTEGLAHRFVMESGAAIHGVSNGIEAIPATEAHAVAEALAADLCPDAADVMSCLRGLPADELIGWTGSDVAANWTPVIEGEGGVLPQHPHDLMASGDFLPGEIIIGSNRNENGLFALTGAGSSATAAEFMAFLDTDYTEDAAELQALYLPDGAGAADADAAAAHITLMTDVSFRCIARRLARLAVEHDRDVYLYSYEHGAAWHGDELAYVFGDEYYTIEVAKLALGTIDPDLTEATQRYWLNFAATGDPNGGDLPTWPVYTADSDPHMTLLPTPESGSGLQTEQCDFWDAYLER